MRKQRNNRPRTFLTVSLAALFLFAAPSAVFGAETPTPGTEPPSANVTMEYRYTQGDTAAIPETITQFGRNYDLVSQEAPVLESSLPINRTYTYRFDGAILPEDLAAIEQLQNVAVTPVDLVFEREVDKAYTDFYPNNDVKKLPQFKEFEVTSGITESGVETRVLELAGVSYEVAEKEDGLPTLYKANMVFRGVETGKEVGYYVVDTVYSTVRQEGSTNTYVIVATYEPVGDIVPAASTETETNVVEEVPPVPIPEGEFTPSEQAKLDDQTGNPFVDIANNNVPLGNGSITSAWSLLSLILAVIALVTTVFTIGSVLLGRRYRRSMDELGAVDKENRRQKNSFILAVLTCAFGVLTFLIWLVLDDRSLPMVWFNRYTDLVFVFFLLNIVLFIARRTAIHKIEQEPDSLESGNIA
ncbi:MAG: hypothetical protein LBS85_06380 [Clostridiales Family XIII bacterium]|jgi:hypothetical protein|nr:hypothetical protein [Clostridiales Family XIII bacterium]